jgi:hypothetical protein
MKTASATAQASWIEDERIALMKTSTARVANSKVVGNPSRAREKRCLACGKPNIDARRRYCSKECRDYINWVLSLSKGLLRAVNARYAAFSFTDDQVILDVFPVWSKHISRFVHRRIKGNKPAEDLKNLVLQFGQDWHDIVNNNGSRSYASLCLVNQNHKKDIHPNSIRPSKKSRPRLSRQETRCLEMLKLQRTDLAADGCTSKIKSAYKKMAKVHHPDVGGDEEKFKKLNDAHEQMLLWAENPQYTSRKALRECWSYDGATSRWSPPL